jgi:hypothetical protein
MLPFAERSSVVGEGKKTDRLFFCFVCCFNWLALSFFLCPTPSTPRGAHLALTVPVLEG